MVRNKKSGIGACSGALLAVGLGLGALGCGDGDAGISASTPSEATASVQIELTTVPPSALCVRFTATPLTGGTATVKTFTVTAGASSAALSFGKLVPGSYTLAGDAFNVACASIGTNVADWIADSVTLNARAGVTSSPTLTFRKNSAVSVAANFVNNVQSLALGGYDSYAVTDGGILETGLLNGAKVFTRLNLAAFDTTTVPGNAVVSLAVTYHGACAARADGTVWCWGTNSKGELGPGIANGATSLTPTQVPGISGATQVVAGIQHSCALASSGLAVYCWGYNALGQLGNNTTTSSATPILSLSYGIKQIAAGRYTTYALDRNENYFYAWGYNAHGEVGDGTTTSTLTPQPVSVPPVRALTAGSNHACIQLETGAVQCWGENDEGEIGNGTTTSSSVPVTVPGLVAQQIAAHAWGTCAINTAGKTLCWGYNLDGEIGDGSSTDRWVPTQVALGGVTLTSVASSSSASSLCGIASTLDVYCWGDNTRGQLGDGTSNNGHLPVRPQLQ